MDRGARGALHRAATPAAGAAAAVLPEVGGVALTFDDGPSSSCTERVLDVLAAWRARATFFVLGRHAEGLPDLVKRMVDEGHTVGNHGYSHRTFRPAWDTRALAEELQRCQEALWKAARVETALYRPPHGAAMPWVRRWLRRRGWACVGWDVSAGDWRKSTPDAMARRVLQGVRRGSIVLLHDGWPRDLEAEREGTVGALPLVLAGLADLGIGGVGGRTSSAPKEE